MWSNILDRLILNLSDQQLATCFAILVTALIRYCQISLYHLNLITDLAWFSTITHLLSIIILRHYWLQESKKLALYVRSVLIMLAIVMLLYVVLSLFLWSAGNLSCPAICGYNDPMVAGWIGDPFIFIFRRLSAVGADICIVFWVYPTTCLFVFPGWYRFYHFIMWKVPGRVFRCLQRLSASDTGTQSLRTEVSRLTQSLSDAYRKIFFPSQGFAIVVQVLIWCVRFEILVVDRLGTQKLSVYDPGAENQLGFGQLLALIILFLPFLTLLESWSGEFRILVIYHFYTKLIHSLWKNYQYLGNCNTRTVHKLLKY
jgi:hypothetical protein